MRLTNITLTWLVCVCLFLTSVVSSRVYAQTAENVKMVPEYERSLKRAVISLDAAHPTLDLQEELLEKLPAYSQIMLLAPRDQFLDLTESLEHKPFGDRVTVLPFRTDWVDDGYLDFVVQDSDQLKQERITDPLPLQWGTIWAQDLFEVGMDADSTLTALVPPLHMAYWQKDPLNSRKPVSDTDYLYTLTSQGIEVIRLPFVFSGGNILMDVVDGRKIAFCGGDILRQTRAVKERFPHMVAPPEQLPGLIREYLGVDDVVIVGYHQPTLMFHLDQAMMLLGGRTAAVLTVTGPLPKEERPRRLVKDVITFTADLTMRLKDRDYSIIPIEADSEDLLHYRLSTNGVVFTHAETGVRTVLLPVFSGETSATFTETEQRNIDRLTALGLDVIPVYTDSGKLRGGPHCMLNVLE